MKHVFAMPEILLIINYYPSRIAPRMRRRDNPPQLSFPRRCDKKLLPYRFLPAPDVHLGRNDGGESQSVYFIKFARLMLKQRLIAQ